MFKRLMEKIDKRKEAFMEHVSQEVKDRVAAGHHLTLGEWKNFRGNSYERSLLYPLMDDGCLVDTIKYFMLQAGVTKMPDCQLPDHYGDALSRQLLPLLIDRLEPSKIGGKNEDVLSLVDECYEIDDSKEERAASKGLEVVLPNKFQLQIDIDSEDAWERLCLQLSNLEIATGETFTFACITTSESGGPHRHATLTWPWEIKSEWERVALQFALCSDFKRECLGAFRLAAGLKDVTCFFEKPADDCDI